MKGQILLKAKKFKTTMLNSEKDKVTCDYILADCHNKINYKSLRTRFDQRIL